MSVNKFVVTLVNEEHYTSKKKITFTVVKNYLLSKNRNTYKTVRMNICCWLCSWEILWNKKELKKPIYLPMCPVAATLNDCMRRWLICNDVMWTWKYMLFCHIDFTLFQCLLVMMTCSVLSLCLLLLWVNHCLVKLCAGKGGSPGLVVKWGDSQSEGCEFESRRRILDGHFSHLYVVRIVMFIWKDENKRKKRPGFAHLKKLCRFEITKLSRAFC